MILPSDSSNLWGDIRSCQACPLIDHCTAPVPGKGPNRARLMLVGEAPGRNEDESGIPFSGQAGTILDDALSHAHLHSEPIYITNVVHCRPSNNRTPTEAEARFCGDRWLAKEIALVQPDLIVPMGLIALRYLTNDWTATMEHYHGQLLQPRGAP